MSDPQDTYNRFTDPKALRPAGDEAQTEYNALSMRFALSHHIDEDDEFWSDDQKAEWAKIYDTWARKWKRGAYRAQAN